MDFDCCAYQPVREGMVNISSPGVDLCDPFGCVHPPTSVAARRELPATNQQSSFCCRGELREKLGERPLEYFTPHPPLRTNPNNSPSSLSVSATSVSLWSNSLRAFTRASCRSSPTMCSQRRRSPPSNEGYSPEPAALSSSYGFANRPGQLVTYTGGAPGSEVSTQATRWVP